jgi:hypothetical protein
MNEFNITPEEKEEMIKEIAEIIINRVKRNAYEKVKKDFGDISLDPHFETLKIHYIFEFDRDYLLDILDRIRKRVKK